MTTAYSSQEAGARRSGNFAAWFKCFALIANGPMPKPEDTIAAFLDRHHHDLPPALWIELERRRMIP
jgi:hypothetical protein